MSCDPFHIWSRPFWRNITSHMTWLSLIQYIQTSYGAMFDLNVFSLAKTCDWIVRLLKFRGNDAAVFSSKESLWSACGELTVSVSKMLILKVSPSHLGDIQVALWKPKAVVVTKWFWKLSGRLMEKKKFLMQEETGESFLTTFTWE